jgi:hypothetical protein
MTILQKRHKLMQSMTFLHCHLNEPNPDLVYVTKINITNITDMTTVVYNDVATHLFIDQYQK